ncbi:glycoside hydrolase family 28 protein [Hymenobacter sp. BT770]|uniref:glycoside hydrolase family 28 protein n=1 Tax=Hymenobacter sp. BT770 TaxID=2886942 RepID=UPI001D11C89D|nr:glycoside hydrolase family 28 protein [Hymenobacter sp. BT770]MCC3154962.1 glycoside hydrolase family 28 protein [Hymenobacter sp. BT770]MDO3416858.1 glycoside hydrolase family 28 protein [Hymenobacter sp. BT770]
MVLALLMAWVGLNCAPAHATGTAANPAKQYPITAYGAKGDGQTLNTAAIQATLDACAAAGGGVVVVTTGVFVSGALFLRPHVSLRIEKEGVLKGSINPDDYPQVKTRWEGIEREWTAALVNADGLTDFVISGEGTIDGSGDEWVRQAQLQRQANAQPIGPPRGRPRLLGLQNCQNVRVAGLRLHNQAVWCLHILYCRNVTVANLTITADHNIPSSDGIDVDSSEKVRIVGCSIDVNDDCISIKSGKDADGLRVNRPSAHILIEQCHFGYGHGGVAMGSETSGGIRRVRVRNCVADAGNWAPIRFKSQPSRGGVVEHITYKNMQLLGTGKAVEFNMAWRMVPPLAPPAPVLPVVRHVRLVHLWGSTTVVGDFHGLPGSPITDVRFRRCRIRAQRGLTLEHTRRVRLAGLHMAVQDGPALVQLSDVQ